MKKVGIVSYNIRVTYTNYGSALQSYALCKKIKDFGFDPYLIDYVPKKFENFNTLDPIANPNWNADENTKSMIRESKEAFLNNYIKFERFYTNNFKRIGTYSRKNFNTLGCLINSFVCGSDTIFCTDEFGFENGYYANYKIMKKHSIAYSASFGDDELDEERIQTLKRMVKNFNAISIREEKYLNLLRSLSKVRVERTIDPTLLLGKEEYFPIMACPQIDDHYILYYSRRYNEKMDKFVRELAQKNGLKIVEISLKASNEKLGSIMRYDAGVEEFLSLINGASYVVTNSFHGMLLSIVFEKQFFTFVRPQNGHKMVEITSLLGISNRLTTKDFFPLELEDIDYTKVRQKLEQERTKSLEYLEYGLKKCL